MKATEFKKLWITDALDEEDWVEYDLNQLDASPVGNIAKDFLKIGFPRSAAPFLDFDWIFMEGEFLNASQLFAESNGGENYWVFGSDNNGNPICFDVANQDKIVILEHEEDFKLAMVMNQDITELAQCLLAFKNFSAKILAEIGEDEDLEDNITTAEFENLKNEFKKINPDIFTKSDFWRGEISSLQP